MFGGFGAMKEMNDKIKQNQELKKNATKSRLSRDRVYYKKSKKEKKEMAPVDKVYQKERMQAHRDFIKRRDRITVIVSLLTLAIIVALLFIFVI